MSMNPKAALSSALLLLSAALALPPSSSAQNFRNDDPVLRMMWELGMKKSQAERLSQVLADSIGPRLSGSPQLQSAVDWLRSTYRSWGIEVRAEQYGTWRGWEQGVVHVDLIAPRVQTLEAKLLAWSQGTDGPVEGEVVAVPDFATEAEADDWLKTVKGKIILLSAPQPSCRDPESVRRLATPETFEKLEKERSEIARRWRERMSQLNRETARAQQRLQEAGVLAALQSGWARTWGINKIFSTSWDRAPVFDLSCEDYGIVARLAENGQGPRLRVQAEAEFKGTVPMFNVIAEIEGTELPGEYVMLSAHLDSWHGAQGATDNGTGTVMMMEAMRILKEAYPNPRRTILVGHWGGEEQGTIGSRSFTEDHSEIIDNIQVLFNQDNGTWRIEYLEAQGYLGLSGHLARWYSQLPLDISRHITLGIPGQQENSGSDHTSFICRGVPATRFQSNYADYRKYTWHSNRDTYDKIIFDDLKNNATLAAMMVYLASEDPERVPRDKGLLPVSPRTGEPRSWPQCRPARRSFEG